MIVNVQAENSEAKPENVLKSPHIMSALKTSNVLIFLISSWVWEQRSWPWYP